MHWVLFVQESVLNSVVARLKLRMAGMKCVSLATDEDRIRVESAVQEAQQQGATVRNCWQRIQLNYMPVKYLTITQ